MVQYKDNKTDNHYSPDSSWNIFDKSFKRMITLSCVPIISFINKTFNKNYPLNTRLMYNWTEVVDDKLKKTLADTILTLVNDAGEFLARYHIEAQSYDDDKIVLRMFDYGYRHAAQVFRSLPFIDGNNVQLDFPIQLIIYLDNPKDKADHYEVTLNFNEQGEFTYKIPVIYLQDKNTAEYNSENLIIFIPFRLLELREHLRKSRDEASISRLKELYKNDIIKVIEESYHSERISRNDMNVLIALTNRLFKYLYSDYQEVREADIMHDESLDLEIDHYIDALEDAENRVAERDKTIAALEAEIEALKKEKQSLV